MRYQSRYYVDKTTGTSADVSEAYGLAKLLRTIFPRNRVTIRDMEISYAVELSQALTEEVVAVASYQALNPYIRIGRKNTTIPSDVVVADLDAQYEILAQLKAIRQAQIGKGNEKRNQEQREVVEEQKRRLEELKPDDEFPLWDAMQHTRLKAHDTYNSAVLRWHSMRDHFPDLLRIILLRYSASPNLSDESEREWKELVKRLGRSGDEASLELSAVQMYNPGMGKGVNKDKPTGVSKGGLGNFWVAEYLKHAGLYMAGITLMVGDDRKMYVLCPRKIALNKHETIFKMFRDSFRRADHPFKADIMVSLTYTQAFLRYVDESPPNDQDPFEPTPSDAVSGFQSTLYKTMGQAAAVMNLSFLNLPTWVRPNAQGQVRPYLGILEEHVNVIDRLGRTPAGQFIGRGDQIDLLRAYRDFLSANDLEPFFRFAIGYSQYLTQAIPNAWRYAMFTTLNLERMVIMSKPQMEKVVTNPGFLRIADAIRQSTVSLQRRKAQGQTISHDIRYGLGIELARAASNANKPEMFVQALGDFIFRYNAETAQVQENTRDAVHRTTVRVSDLDEIIRLIDEFDSKTVCALLVAYGYASSGKGKSGDDDTAEQVTEEAANE